jgi:hypothetical protein
MIAPNVAPELDKQEDCRPDIIREMRAMACRGSTARDLVSFVQSELELRQDALLPVLWYFMKAYALPLPDVLPIREWLGTQDDKEIDARILPALGHTRALWDDKRQTQGV